MVLVPKNVSTNKIGIFAIAGIVALLGASAFTLLTVDDPTTLAVSSIPPNDFSRDLESVGFVDNVSIVIRDGSGNITHEETVHNKVLTHGENCVSKMIFGVSGGDESGNDVCIGIINAGFRYIGLGEGTTSPADTDTDLENAADESGLSTPLLSTAVWTNSTTSSFNTVVLSATFTNAGSSEDISEAVLFNATDSSTRGAYARATFTPATVTNGGDITINWTFETGEAAVP